MGRSAASGGIELPVRVGEVLDGKFRIDHVLGIGGMGVVYAATHMQLAQKVAIKLILPSGNKEEVQRLQRLLREARVVAQMKSPHVAHVLDVGTLDSGAPYMVMELLNGVDLERHLEKHNSVPATDAIDFILQICEAVAEAHALGVVHRDLKPSNLFLTKGVDKRPLMKVLDFGLSKSVRDESAHTGASITRPLEVIGTPKYMSPEQLRSTRDVDERTDIWSLGIIFYELLVGVPPFSNESIPDLCAAIVRDPPPQIPIEIDGVPDGLEAVIHKCLQKFAKDRYRNITELAESLAPYTTDPRRIERVRNVQRQATIPPELEDDPLDAPVSQRRQVHIPTQVIRRDNVEEAIADDDDDLDDDAMEARLRRPSFLRRLAPVFVVLIMLGVGAGTALLALKMMNDGNGTVAATPPAAAAAATATPITATTDTALAVPGNEAIGFAQTKPAPSTSSASAVSSQRGLRPLTRPLTRPGASTASGGGGVSTARPPGSVQPTTTPPAGPVDPDKLLESR